MMAMYTLVLPRSSLLVVLVVLALACCANQVFATPKCVALCHRSEEDSLCKRCRFREPMRFGKRSDNEQLSNIFREPMRFGKRLHSDRTATTGCYHNQFQCDNGLCIPAKLHCDGYNDCLDFSDEKKCARLSWSKIFNMKLPLDKKLFAVQNEIYHQLQAIELRRQQQLHRNIKDLSKDLESGYNLT